MGGVDIPSEKTALKFAPKSRSRSSKTAVQYGNTQWVVWSACGGSLNKFHPVPALLLKSHASSVRQFSCRHTMKIRPFSSSLAMLVLLAAFPLCGQTPTPSNTLPAANAVAALSGNLPDAPSPAQQSGQPAANPPASPTSPAASSAPQTGQQTKRILYIVPNFRAVSSEQKLPPQSVKEKFLTATQDSFDYSSFIFVGGQAGVNQARKTTPEFRQGAAGYGRYYWHTFADTVDENLWVEFLLPVALRQDSRFYTLNKGNFGKRLVYSATRAFITRTDGGRETVNASEIVGAGASAGISSLYYPSPERTFTKTYQRWFTSMAIDDATFVFKEFWPNLNDRFFHQKD